MKKAAGLRVPASPAVHLLFMARRNWKAGAREPIDFIVGAYCGCVPRVRTAGE